MINGLLFLIYPILLFLLVFYKARPAGRTGGNDSFWCSEQTHLIRAGACVGVILHHVTQQVTSYGARDIGPVTVFNYLGILFTALFFFYSGFGLITNVYSRPDYLSRFLYTRLPRVLIPFWTVNALGVLLNITVYGVHWDKWDVFCRISGIELVNSNGWFIVEIVILYLLFHILFSLIRKKDAALLLLCLAVAALMLYSFFQPHDLPGAKVHWFRGEWWYNSTIAFILGTLSARFREKITKTFRNQYTVWIGAFTVLFLLTLYVSIHCVTRFGYYREGSLYWRNCAVTLVSQMAACSAFVIFVQLLNLKIVLGNPALNYMSTISTELFLIHGYFVSRIFGQVKMGDFARYAVVLVCSISCSALVSPCVRWLVRKVTGSLDGSIRAVGTCLSEHLSARRRMQEEAGKKKHGKHSGKLIVSGISICLAIVPAASVYRIGYEKAECKKELGAIKEAREGDVVLWGRFETDPAAIGKERLPWIVIEKEGDRVCLLCRDGIAGSYYHQKHEAVSWEDCDLRELLNAEAFTGMFSRYERHSMEAEDGDLITLLTTAQARTVFPADKDRIMAVTETAKRQGTNADRVSHQEIWFDQNYCYSWWWLRGERGEEAVTAPIVNMDGSISMEKKPVNKPSGAIRPAIWVNVKE